jgi:D-alanine-D-alanine ligase
MNGPGRGSRLRALVVVHASLVPPENLEGYSEKQIEEWRTEYDVASTLRASGHEVRCLGVLDSLTELRAAIADWKPDIVFNLLEEFDGIVTYDQHVVAFLELLRQPYTGCNPRGLLLSRDKSLCKQLLAFHRIPTPQFTVFGRGVRFRVPRKLKFPLFVKSTVEDASLGIAQASVVEDAAKLRERVEFVHEQVKSDALVEEFIEGRELYVGIMGNDRLTRLPVWEMVFGSMPDSLAAIATRKVKWDKRYQARYGITTRAAEDLPPALVARLDKLSRRIYRALGLSGYARMDFRLTSEGAVYVLEANANPNLEAEEDFAESARAAGIGYQELLAKLIQLGRTYKAGWRATYG